MDGRSVPLARPTIELACLVHTAYLLPQPNRTSDLLGHAKHGILPFRGSLALVVPSQNVRIASIRARANSLDEWKFAKYWSLEPLCDGSEGVGFA